MTDSTHPADALLTEHFRYTPLSLIDEIINAVNTIIYRALEAIENGLFSIPPATLGFTDDTGVGADPDGDARGDGEAAGERFKDEIENGVHRLETLLEATVDKTFDRFEIFTLRNILTVPDDLSGWMRLAHYENLTLPLPASAPTPESILQLRRKLQSTKSLNLALRSTHSRNAALLSSLHSLLDPPSSTTNQAHPSLSFLTQNHPFSSSSDDENPLTKRAQSAISQLPALRALLADLRPRLETLRAAAVTGDTDRDIGRDEARDRDRYRKREERRRYIESRVRKVVKGGETEIGGGRMAEEEMEGLENVLRGLESEGGGDDDGGGGGGGGGGERGENEEARREGDMEVGE